MQLAKTIYRLTSKFPSKEQFGIVLQMKRAAVSIPSNIAEGYGRKSKKEYRNFFSIAYGSALELETQLILAKEMNLAPQKEFHSSEQLLLEVLKMLNSMTSKLRRAER